MGQTSCLSGSKQEDNSEVGRILTYTTMYPKAVLA